MSMNPAAATTETIWADFHRELLAFIRRRVTDPDAAQDLLQDVFVKIHLKLPTLTYADKLTSWVYQITRNRILDYQKAQRGLVELDGDIPDVADPAELNPGFAPCITPFVDKLPAASREALLRTELGALSQKDYAAELGISYSGAKSRVQRAKQQLHQLFTACCRMKVDSYGNILEAQPRHQCGCTAARSCAT
ncbi:sigma-70 family RNA polymerase sigma factor [Hymenobacter sp. BT186]|uniref:Sigma-70 family RNA polymerase sigma factor n=1 Tax=Hymenobacter telluris TaxID=2816474 RepID=A0A939F0D3_9BACT|nr:sigma-70 family RNA polymerase sigma factor [Hymenobacter telluris]MBO0360441.1 sigma-70 family RNA polymerase sigma factor [Hymenobacter telluris]MBW3376468.1 sigma-70 family RNA polymerase sigma factor [Hymenobacter norwichensis]